MILTQPSYRTRAAGAFIGPAFRLAAPNYRIALPQQQSVSTVYTTAPTSTGLLASLQAKWSALSTVGKVAVAGGGAVALVLVLGAIGGKKRR